MPAVGRLWPSIHNDDDNKDDVRHQHDIELACRLCIAESLHGLACNWAAENVALAPTLNTNAMSGAIDRNAMRPRTQCYCPMLCNASHTIAKSRAIDRNAMQCTQQFCNVQCYVPTSQTNAMSGTIANIAKQCRASPHLTNAKSALSRAMQCANLKHQYSIWCDREKCNTMPLTLLQCLFFHPIPCAIGISALN